MLCKLLLFFKELLYNLMCHLCTLTLPCCRFQKIIGICLLLVLCNLTGAKLGKFVLGSSVVYVFWKTEAVSTIMNFAKITHWYQLLDGGSFTHALPVDLKLCCFGIFNLILVIGTSDEIKLSGKISLVRFSLGFIRFLFRSNRY